jgi:hypothetical protein
VPPNSPPTQLSAASAAGTNLLSSEEIQQWDAGCYAAGVSEYTILHHCVYVLNMISQIISPLIQLFATRWQQALPTM